jgi:hypothetical protein
VRRLDGFCPGKEQLLIEHRLRHAPGSLGVVRPVRSA